MAQSIPLLEKRENTTQLIVKGNPFVMLAGELHNSTSSDIQYLETIWARLKAMNLNSVIASVSWEMIEQEEGIFDFKVVDGIIEGARRNNLKLALIWFGSWKNGTSSYVPLWVKKDTIRFFRVKDQGMAGTFTISPFCQEAMKSDAKAFRELMKHIRLLDAEENTVVIMQVENEMGMFQVEDFGAASVKAWRQPVPDKLVNYMLSHEKTLEPELNDSWIKNGKKTKGSWAAIFGNSNESHEFLNAWQYAAYANEVAKAGKQEYPLPMYVNAWLINDPAFTPGMYPCGGPVSKVMDIYKAAAPELDFQAPDIYIPRFKEVCNLYHRSDNPLFIPEHSNDAKTAAANAFWAFSQHDAICFAPFGIESMNDSDKVFSYAFETLGNMLPLIARYQGSGRMIGILKEENDPATETTISLGGKEISIRYIKEYSPVFGLIIQTADDEFIIAGHGFEALFLNDKGRRLEVGPMKELKYLKGEWVEGRWFNGDESCGNGPRVLNFDLNTKGKIKPVVVRVKTYTF